MKTELEFKKAGQKNFKTAFKSRNFQSAAELEDYYQNAKVKIHNSGKTVATVEWNGEKVTMQYLDIPALGGPSWYDSHSDEVLKDIKSDCIADGETWED